VNDEVQLQNIKHLIWDTAVNEPRVVAEGGLPRVLDVMQRLRRDNSQVGEGERQYLRDSTYLGPNVCKNLKDWMRQYPVQPRNLHEGESASQQPSYPTDHEVLLWRDGVLAELNWAEGGHYYCDRPICDDCDYTEGELDDLCLRYDPLRDLLENGSIESIAGECSKCHDEYPLEAAHFIQMGKLWPDHEG
jgi:hypothetical protein